MVDVTWLDGEVLSELLRLGREGLPVPSSPAAAAARASCPYFGYDRELAQLLALPNVSADLPRVLRRPPLVAGAGSSGFLVPCRRRSAHVLLCPSARTGAALSAGVWSGAPCKN